MRNILMKVSYDGTCFHGSQKQKGMRTVQGTLEQALEKLLGIQIKTVAAGRTDAGAHARYQAVNFHAPDVVPVEKFPQALNSLLPSDLVVWEACEVDSNFNSRFKARGKRYTYTIDNARFPQPLEARYSWHCSDRLDLELMQRAAQLMIGEHDFREFRATGSNVQNTVRNMFEVSLERVPERNLVRITVVGEGFLYKMVRFMAGALVRTGQHRLSLEVLPEVLAGNASRKWKSLPARGLCLEEIFF